MGALGIGAIFDFGSKVIDKIFPDKAKADEAKLEMLKLQQAGQFKELELQYSAMAKQADINIEEAKNPNIFVAGWRPAVGWVCVIGLLYSIFVQPILAACKVDAPVTDVSVIIELLFAMMGVGILRSYDKQNGVDTRRLGGK